VSVADVAAATRDMLMLTLLLLSPFLATAMLAAFVVGVLQASLRINDLTLSFVPRFVATVLSLYVAAWWAMEHLASYLERCAVAARSVAG
jgi:flagellar biosynthetic protein FliQ